VSRGAWHKFLHIENRLASLIGRLYIAHRIELTGNTRTSAVRRDQYATIVLASQVNENKAIPANMQKASENERPFWSLVSY
jgi:hypothetical protein